MVKLSIIIPTLNEENYIGRLLDSIKNQRFKDYEIIIVDSNSKDKTKHIAESFKKLPIKFLTEKQKGIGQARNVGASIAKGNIFLFLDADVVLPSKFLRTALAEFEERFLSIAAVNQLPLASDLRNKIYHQAYNSVTDVLQYVYPGAQGVCLFTTKRLHERIVGFDEKLRLGEDADYVKRASKLAKYRKLVDSFVYVSTRRIDKEKIGSLLAKYAKCDLNRALKKYDKVNEIKYDFGEH